MGLWRDTGGWRSWQRLAKAGCQGKAGKDWGGGPEDGASRRAREDGEWGGGRGEGPGEQVRDMQEDFGN